MIRKFTAWGGVVVSDASRPIKIVQERLLGPAAVVMLKAAYLYKKSKGTIMIITKSVLIQSGPERMQHLRSIISRKRGTD